MKIPQSSMVFLASEVAKICKAMASSSSNNVPFGQYLGFRPSYVAQAIPGIIQDSRNSVKNYEDKLSILNNYLSKCNQELNLASASAFKLQFPQYCPMLLQRIELLKNEIGRINDLMGYDKKKKQFDLNAPIVDHDQYTRQETNQGDSFVVDPVPNSTLIPVGLNSESVGIKQRPLTRPIYKNNRILWTPELHARFVESLRKLGGPKAKPKQITECMQVAGLTTEQAKSHLQRYRQIWKSEQEGGRG